MRTPLPAQSRSKTPLLRLALLGIAFGLAILSCRDVTSPGASARYARGIAWRTQFPAAYKDAGVAATSIVDFNRVRIVLHHSDGTVALDTVVDFAAGTDSLPLTLDVKLLPSAPSTGEPLSLNLAYINATGDTVFKGGPVTVTAVPTTASTVAPAPVTIPVAYTGPGATAVGVQITPHSGATASSGNTYTYNAVAVDGSGNPVAGTPIFWSSLDTTAATVPNPAVGTVLAVGSVRTTARIVAQLLTGQTDQVVMNVQPPATSIFLQSGSGQTGTVGSALSAPLVVMTSGADEGPVGGVSVTFTVTGGGGSVANTTVVTNSSGIAQTTWTLGGTAGAQTVTATAGTLGGSPIDFTATATAPAHLQVTTSPATAQVAGATVTPGFVVSAYDATNTQVPSFTGTVTLAIGTNPGSSTLSGTASVSAVGGVATFNAFSLNKVGTGYTVVASTAGYASGTSAAFNIAAGPAASIAISGGNGQTGPANTVLPQPLSATVTDASGNPVSGVTVHFAVATGGGSVGTAAPVTNASGIATTTWTVGPSGAQSVGAAALNALGQPLAGSPLVYTANGSGSVASTTVAPHTVTILSLGDVTTLVATSHDASNNVVSGTYGWVSRTPAVATVNATTGVVTGVTNGTAYVVATELGGTKDSALVTVAQSVATINVTPNTRTIYLTGTFTFTAQAVDGRGNPLAAQPTFVWSSSAPAIAGVNSSTGLATALSIGAVQIKATAGAITGVSNVSVLSAIQHIYVVPDTGLTAVQKSDTFSMAALQLHRAYRAFAFDTLNNPVTGLTFTWTSTNSSVALVDTTAALRADVISNANGNASIQASVQGVTGAALLNVQQVLTSIAITPVSPTIAVSGSVALIARGKDSNGQFIAGGTFTWASATPGNVSVNTATGVATGVALGTSNITATSGSINSAVDVVTVSSSVPPVISFGRDTVSVGRGSTTQVPILLSTPSASPVVINLAVADTFAFWSSASVTIPAGQTSINAQLNGHNAGTTHVTATDAASIYATATSVLAVQATMHLTTTGYSLNAPDQLSTQILLSDPSPVGGTFVTFNYSTPNVASVSPSPAFIPAGQLAANIVISGVAAGSTNITPVAIGVNGTASSFTTYPATLTFSTTTVRLGTGQFEPSVDVQTQTYALSPVPVTFTSSDTTIATVTASATIPTNLYYVYPTITAKGPGVATITASSPGWTVPNHVTVTVTTPHIGTCCSSSWTTTTPTQTYYVYAEDSVKSVHDLTNSLVVHVSSSDTTVLKVLDSVVTIAPGTYYNNTGRVTPGGAGGSAYLKVSAGGATSDSVLFTVVGPKLAFSWTTSRVGLGEEDDNMTVQVPNNVTTPLVVTLTADTSIAGVPPTVTIPTGQSYTFFNVRGKALGSVPIYATAPGYQSDTATYIVTSPHLTLFGGTTLNNFAAPSAFTVESADSVGNAHVQTAPLPVHYTSTNTSVITVDTGTTIAAGFYYSNTPQVTPVGVGTAMVIATAAGYQPDTITYVVQTPSLSISFGSIYTIGALEQQPTNSFIVQVPDYRTTPLAVTLTQKHPSVMSLSPTSFSILAGAYYNYFTLAGLVQGVDTVIASAPGYKPDTSVVRVTTPQFGVSGAPSQLTTTSPPFTMNVYAEDSLTSVHYAINNITVHAVSSDTTVLQPAQAYFPITAGSYYAAVTVNVVGPGKASITYSDSAGLGFKPVTTNTVTVTGPSLSMSSSNIVLGQRQNTGVNGILVQVPNAVTTPLVITLTSTDPTVAITTAGTATIPIGASYTYFQINAQDVQGTIQIKADAPGYSEGITQVQVTAPKFVFGTSTAANTTGGPQSVTVYAEDANGNTHTTNENVTVTLASSAPSVATFDSATVTILAGAYYNNLAHWIPAVVGTTQLSAADLRGVGYQYTTGTLNVTVNTPTLQLNSFNGSLGIGQYSDSYWYVQTPDYQTSPLVVTLSHPGTARTSAPATVTIPATQYYAYFRLIGTAIGTDTLVASTTSPVYNPATGLTTVGNGLFYVPSWPSRSLHASTPDSVAITIYATDPVIQAVRNVIADVPLTLTPGAGMYFMSGGANSAIITTATIPANAQSVTVYLKAYLVPGGGASGTASMSIAATNYTTYTNNVTVIP